MKTLIFTAIISVLAISGVEVGDFTVSQGKPLRTQNLASGEVLDHELCSLEVVKCPNEQTFIVSAYNTVPSQTDSDSCVSASGDNICGRNNVVACPRRFPFGTIFTINGKDYVCLDRLNPKYDNRLDVSFDKDIKGAKEWGLKKLDIIIKTAD